MSYILDALKNSDQQRQRGMTPTLLTSQAAVAAFEQPAYLFYAVFAAVLISSGVAIGWLRPWPFESALPEVKAVPVTPAVAQFQGRDPGTRPEMHEIPQQPRPEISLKPYFSDPVVMAAENRPAMKKDMPAPPIDKKVAPAPEAGAMVGQEKSTPPDVSPEQMGGRTMAELPISIQQEISKISISGLVYSGDSDGRMVGINGQLVREGEFPFPGLKVEEITPDGVIFSYKKYRFRRDAP